MRHIIVLALLIGLGWILYLSRDVWLALFVNQLDFVKENAELLQGIEALVQIALWVLTGFTILLGFNWYRRQTDGTERPEPLLPVTTEKLRRRLGLGGQVKWINRDATDLDDLLRHRRIIISGPPNLGKTREAIELAQRAINTDRISRSRLFEPTEGLKILELSTIPTATKQCIEIGQPVLLFVDDLAHHYSGKLLENLSAVIESLKDCTALYIVATDRPERLMDEHRRWLEEHGFYEMHLRGVRDDEVRGLADHATDVSEIELEGDAVDFLVEESDGTPELILMTFWRMKEKSILKATRDDVVKYHASSVSSLWLDLRQDLIQQRPQVEYLFRAIGLFHSAGVRPYTELIIALAADLERTQSPRTLDFVLRWRYKRLIQSLSNYLSEENGQLIYSEDLAEAELN